MPRKAGEVEVQLCKLKDSLFKYRNRDGYLLATSATLLLGMQPEVPSGIHKHLLLHVDVVRLHQL